MIRSIVVALLLAGCGSSKVDTITPADKAAIQADLNAQRDLVVFCDSDAGCTGAQVRIVEEGSECNLGSFLQRHGVDQRDAGAGCHK